MFEESCLAARKTKVWNEIYPRINSLIKVYSFLFSLQVPGGREELLSLFDQFSFPELLLISLKPFGLL